MKVVIAVHHFPPRFIGGSEAYAHRVASHLQARGHKVHVLCVEHLDTGPDGSVTWEDEIYEGIQVRRLSFNLRAAPDPFRWEYDNPWIGQHLSTFLSEYRPDVFHLISGYLMSGRALQVACERGIPTLVTLTDFWFLCPRITLLRPDGQRSTLPLDAVTCARCLGEEKRRYRLPGYIAPGLMDIFWRLQQNQVKKIEERMAFLHQTLAQADAILSPSQFVRSTYIEAGIASPKIIFCRHGLDSADLTPQMLEKTPSSVLRIGYLGQIAWLKGVHVLFEAARKLPEAQLSVRAYGDSKVHPKYTAHLRRIIAGDDRMQLGGAYHGRQELTLILRELDVIVVPSLWYENCPTVILEAFAHRTPVIASNLGGMAELVEHGKNGLLFAPGNVDSLTQQLQRLLDEPDLLPTLRAGIGPVKSVAQEIDELEQIYQRAIANHSLKSGTPSR